MTTAPRLVPLGEAFERFGVTFIQGWDGHERSAASLGSRRKADNQAWARAQDALKLMREYARDGRLGIVMYGDQGTRRRYFEDAGHELNALLLPPDIGEPGMIELGDGSTMECEADISRLKLRHLPRKRPGPRRFEWLGELCDEAVACLGPRAANDAIRAYLKNHAGQRDWPKSKTTVNDAINAARERYQNRAGQSSNIGRTAAGAL